MMKDHPFNPLFARISMISVTWLAIFKATPLVDIPLGLAAFFVLLNISS